MEPNLQRRIQQYGWDRAAPFYERYWQSQLLPATELLLARANLQPGERVLDVACGTGAVTFAAARAVGADGHVLGTDISAKMIAAAEASPYRTGLGQVALDVSGAENLSTDNGAFDVALCGLGLMYVPSPIEALRQMRRSLGPSGRIVVSVWGERRKCGWAELFPIIESRVASDVCPLFFSLGADGALQYALRQAGFTATDTTRIDVALTYRDDDEALGAAFLGGPVALAYSRLSDADKRSAHHEYLESVSAHRTSSGYRIPGEFVVASARV